MRRRAGALSISREEGARFTEYILYIYRYTCEYCAGRGMEGKKGQSILTPTLLLNGLITTLIGISL